MTTVGVRLIGAPVHRLLGRTPRQAIVVGARPSTALLESEGFVIAVGPSGLPMLPNGIVLDASPSVLEPVRVGQEAALGAGRIEIRSVSAVWDPDATPVWSPSLPRTIRTTSLAATCAAILRSCGIEPTRDTSTLGDRVAASDPDWGDAASGISELLRSVQELDPLRARRASVALGGLGSGATPSGDDLVAGVSLAVRAYGGSAAGPWLAGARLPDLRARTTALSATLLQLALDGSGPEPAHALLAEMVEGTPDGVVRELARLRQLGHSTGSSYAIGMAAATLMLDAGSGR